MDRQLQEYCSVLALKQFKEALDHRLKDSPLLDAQVPQGAVIDARDAALLNNVSKKIG